MPGRVYQYRRSTRSLDRVGLLVLSVACGLFCLLRAGLWAQGDYGMASCYIWLALAGIDVLVAAWILWRLVFPIVWLLRVDDEGVVWDTPQERGRIALPRIRRAVVDPACRAGRVAIVVDTGQTIPLPDACTRSPRRLAAALRRQLGDERVEYRGAASGT